MSGWQAKLGYYTVFSYRYLYQVRMFWYNNIGRVQLCIAIGMQYNVTSNVYDIGLLDVTSGNQVVEEAYLTFI